MSSGSQTGGGAFLAIAFFLIGVFLFFKGFRSYRRYRLLADMPRMPARSVAMGLVEVEGIARPDRVITSPISRTPCVYYRVEIEAAEEEKGGHLSFSRVGNDTCCEKFYLEDETGKILVDPEGADLDLNHTIRRETQPPARAREASETTPPSGIPSDEELNRYGDSVLASKRRSPLRKLAKRIWVGLFYNRGGVYRPTGAYRFTEYCMLAQERYVVAGTCAENPHPRDESDRNMIHLGRNNPIFLIRHGTEKRVESTLKFLSGCAVYGGAFLILYSAAYLLYALGLLRLPWK